MNGLEEPLFLTVTNKGNVAFEDLEGTMHDAQRFEMNTGRAVWTYTLGNSPPYFLWLELLVPGDNYDIRYTGRFSLSPIDADSRLNELLEINPPNIE